MRTRRALRCATVLATFGLLAFSCTAKKNSELMVSVRTDVPVPKDLDAISIRVISFGANVHEETYPIGPSGLHLPATLGIAGDAGKGPIDVEVTGLFGGKSRVIRKLRTTLPQDRVALLTMPLRIACFDQPDCGDGLTCIDGACVDMTIPVDKLVTYVDEKAPQPLNPGNGGCFDLADCAKSAVTLTSTDVCTFSTAGVSGPFTIAIRRPASVGVGACDATNCDVALDRDPTEGWDFAGTGAIKLSPGSCKVAGEAGASVIAITGCGEKTIDVPLCIDSACTRGACDLEWQVGCAPFQMCYTDPSSGAPICRPEGTAQEGASCLGENCAKGLVCWHKTPTDFRCVRWCCGAGHCPAGSTCTGGGAGLCIPG